MNPYWPTVKNDLLSLAAKARAPVAIKALYMKTYDRGDSPDRVIAALVWAEQEGLVAVLVEPESTGQVALTKAGEQWQPPVGGCAHRAGRAGVGASQAMACGQ